MKLSINHEIFRHITNSPEYYSRGDLLFQYRSCDDNYIGFVLPKRLGAAHKRNKFKRRCRALFQLMHPKTGLNKIGIIIKTRSIDVPYRSIHQIFNQFYQHIES